MTAYDVAGLPSTIREAASRVLLSATIGDVGIAWRVEKNEKKKSNNDANKINSPINFTTTLSEGQAK